MKQLKSIEDIDLQPQENKKCWNSGRSWKEEIIYFILVDRFHDDRLRQPMQEQGRRKGFGSLEELQKTCGGTLNGIRNNLGYIKTLGCTAIWLSPVLENNPQSYHGYAIQNFLNIDPRFGSLRDLKDLVEEAHRLDMRVILDVVLNHSGDNWYYLGKNDPAYHKGQRYRFGGWRNANFPLPVELRNVEYYKRKGCVTNWDEYPETCEGDFFSLKKFNHDESEAGLALQELLIKAYIYLFRETDCNGFRLDAIKHLGELPAARFSSKVKEYAKLIGKEPFFIFGEAPAHDQAVVKFLEPAYSPKENKFYQGLDSLLDFPTHYVLPKIAEGSVLSSLLKERFQSIEKFFSFKRPSTFPLITFLDNHDQIEKPYKKRIGARLNENQLLGALGLLICLPGIPCIYYGTEQGLQGEGNSDVFIREAMFSLSDNSHNALDEGNSIYKEVSVLLKLRSRCPELRDGQLAFPSLSEDGVLFDTKDLEMVVFSRRLSDQNSLVVYNSSINESKTVYVKIDNTIKNIDALYERGGTWRVEYNSSSKVLCYSLTLSPWGFLY